MLGFSRANTLSVHFRMLFDFAICTDFIYFLLVHSHLDLLTFDVQCVHGFVL